MDSYYEIDYSFINGCYVKDEPVTSVVYKLTAEKYDLSTGKEDVKVKYYRGVEDDVTGVTNYEILQAGDIKFYGPEYAVGGNNNGALRKVYPESADKPVGGRNNRLQSFNERRFIYLL